MVGAYGTFANKGVYTRPLYVTRIEDRNGNVISSFTPFIDEVISENDAYLMTSLLQGVVNTGTGLRLRATYKLTNEMGGKTGTTQNHSNGWYMGVMPDLVEACGQDGGSGHSFCGSVAGAGSQYGATIFGCFFRSFLPTVNLPHWLSRSLRRPRVSMSSLTVTTSGEQAEQPVQQRGILKRSEGLRV